MARAAAAARARLTVAPQLEYAALTSVCSGLPVAYVQASNQKEFEDMRW
jgi:hypothetical protein